MREQLIRYINIFLILLQMKKLIFINLTPNTIGDTLFLTPIFKIIKKTYPKIEIHITVSPSNYNLLENNPHIDKIIKIPQLERISKKISKIKKIREYLIMYFKLLKTLKKGKYDIAIVGQPNFFLSQSLPWMAQIRKRIGYTYPGSIFSNMLTNKIKFTDPLKIHKRHYLEGNIDLIKPLNPKITEDDKKVYKKITQKELDVAKKILKSRNINSNFICVQAGAKWIEKEWPKKKFKELCKILSKKQNIILLGSKKEYKLNQYIKNNNKNIYNLSGLKLNKTSAILKLSKLLIGNDSGLTHLATAVGTDTVTIYGISDYFHSKPLGNNNNKIAVFAGNHAPSKLYREDTKKSIEMMDAISLEKVLSAINKLNL
jgi:lipopolysaccharide heptosyltransferase II